MHSYDNIYLFIKVVDAGSFIAAAKLLKIGQATVSRRMQALEQQLGFVLFNTNSKGFELTGNGRAVYADFKNKNYEYDNIINKLLEHKTSPRGTIKVSLPPVLAIYQITPYLPIFLRRYPEITLEVCYQNREIDLIKDGFDIAIINHIPQQQTQKIKLIYSHSFYLYCTRKYQEKYGVPMTPQEISQHTVTGHMRDNYTVPNKLTFFHQQSSKSVIVDMPRQITMNSSLQSKQMLYSNKIISAYIYDMSLEDDPNIIKVLPEYNIGTIKYYLLKHPNENKLINQIFCDFVDDLLSKPKYSTDNIRR